ncbi:hypothetical protein GOBAR_AA07961 [Gossypium barbadense]|uniref:Non-specific serine/threonine protein kinase n=1 Tax=Gossypium barbadense TaxID=3634 RepID=A0A2P5YAS1_GOSBA|nr:hypothetical protein GOBAR_AA07961 [Gossypium barbadense]
MTAEVLFVTTVVSSSCAYLDFNLVFDSLIGCELHALRKLSLHSNNFNSSIPDVLSQGTLLRTVYLLYNSFIGNLPTYVFNLMNLLILNVADNYLSDKIATVIQPSFRSIYLSSNDFSDEIQPNFSTGSQLQLINFSYNCFSSEVSTSIGYFQYLQYLWLDLNKLYRTLPLIIKNCSSLIHVSIEDNMLKGLLPGSIVVISNLQVLAL